ncbi:MAG TPA: hypothetical protein VF167_00705 [Longimicrobiaceae bacterium]
MSDERPTPPERRNPGYPAAHAVAGAVESHLIAARAGVENVRELPPVPGRGDIEAIVDTAFWASLRREEGRSPRISLAYLPPNLASAPLLFERKLSFSAGSLTHLAPAVERPGIHLGVWRFDGDLRIWGTTRTVPCYCFVLEVVQPGLLVIKYRRGRGPGKFGNVAVLEGDEVRILDHEGLGRNEYTPTMNALLGLDPDALWNEPTNALVELAVSMRAHGRGGSLLVVPTESTTWQESIVKPIRYSVAPPLAELAELMRVDPERRSDPRWMADFQRAVAAVAGLTAVDGATVINERFDVLAFGVKIGRREGCGPVEEVLVSEPVLHRPRRLLHPSAMGGTRHLSAAQFAHDQHDARALVASQDGRFTVFAWNPKDERVNAHRIEALLL